MPGDPSLPRHRPPWPGGNPKLGTEESEDRPQHDVRRKVEQSRFALTVVAYHLHSLSERSPLILNVASVKMACFCIDEVAADCA